jgi:hypothetical protein
MVTVAKPIETVTRIELRYQFETGYVLPFYEFVLQQIQRDVYRKQAHTGPWHSVTIVTDSGSYVTTQHLTLHK